MKPLKGGRGLKAPWDSSMVRCPDPIKPSIQAQIDEWKTAQITGDKPQPINLYTDKDIEAKAKEVLKQKKSAKVSVQKLLTELGYEVEL
jgi:hypothetical protein